METISGKEFKHFIEIGYTFKGDTFLLGTAILNKEPVQEAPINIPLKTLTRHGLIAGATGTGKTKTLQIIAEQLSLKGVPSLVMDMKGDLSGLAKPGENNDHIKWRHEQIGVPYHPEAMPVELLSLTGENGVKLRATVSEFGPVLLAKILDLNDTQGGIVSLVFKYADDNKWPIVDLSDFKELLKYCINEGKEDIQQEYGSVSSSSVNTILRKIIELEQQGANGFFGEPSFDVNDLVRRNDQGQGIISILRLTDIQDRPKFFSTFMLSLLAEVYATFPEVGEVEKPVLCLFIDEAHLIFDNASKALLDQIETIVKLIRSKGIGIFFITQNPTDVPEAVLSQLGLKVQHALRAFTAKDRINIKRTSENFPLSPYYQTDEVLTSLGTGEALVVALNEKGIPTPLTATLLRAPKSRMDVLSSLEIREIVAGSRLADKYNTDIDRLSATEILKEKISNAHKQAEREKPDKKGAPRSGRKAEKSVIEEISKNTMVRQVGRTIAREFMRGLLGVLGVKK